MSIAEWDALTESRQEWERHMRESDELAALPGCAGVGCNLPGVVRLGGRTWCGGHARWSFGDWFAADEFERIERGFHGEAERGNDG